MRRPNARSILPDAPAGSYTLGMSEDRFVELETKISHQEFLIEQLNQALSLQQMSMTQMDAKLSAVIKKLKDSATPENEIGPAGEKPPHY